MLNSNSRPNTIISQSFIASQFQGYNDPFTKSQPTSSLNQFVRSKQTSDSGFLQQPQNQQSFGFGNITSNQPQQLQSFSRKTNQITSGNVIPINDNNTRPRFQSYDDQNSGSNLEKSRPVQNLSLPQNNNQRYVSPMINKNQFNQPPIQQRPPSQINNMPSSFNQQYQQPPQYQQPQYQQGQFFGSDQQNQFYHNPQSRSQIMAQQQFRPQYRPQSYSQQNQYSQQQLNSSQLNGNSQINSNSEINGVSGSQISSSQLNSQMNSQTNNTRPSLSNNLSQSSIGKKFKLNVSQQFSNSFVLKCVNQPQKSSILSMKQRQRQFRKSIQNFFV